MTDNDEQVDVVFRDGPHDGRVGWIYASAAEPGAVIVWPPKAHRGESVPAQYLVTEHGHEVQGRPHRVVEYIDEPPSSSEN